MIFRLVVAALSVAFCFYAWSGVFRLIAAGYGWHIVIAVCGVALIVLLSDKTLLAPKSD